MDSWKLVEHFYEKYLEIPSYIVYFLSIENVVKGCAMGLSNVRIAKKNLLDIYFVSGILSEEVDFEGWNYDLDFSPLAIYNRSNENFLAYEQEILTISPFNFENLVKLSFNICKRYNYIKKEIDKYYG